MIQLEEPNLIKNFQFPLLYDPLCLFIPLACFLEDRYRKRNPPELHDRYADSAFPIQNVPFYNFQTGDIVGSGHFLVRIKLVFSKMDYSLVHTEHNAEIGLRGHFSGFYLHFLMAAANRNHNVHMGLANDIYLPYSVKEGKLMNTLQTLPVVQDFLPQILSSYPAIRSLNDAFHFYTYHMMGSYRPRDMIKLRLPTLRPLVDR